MQLRWMVETVDIGSDDMKLEAKPVLQFKEGNKRWETIPTVRVPRDEEIEKLMDNIATEQGEEI